MSVHRDSQLDMFAKASPVTAKARGPARRRPSQPVVHSDENMARALEESGNYRILRKLVARPIASVKRPGFSRLGVILDTETTGLNHRSDEIIEIGAVAFTFNDDGAIGDIVGIYGGLQQPSRPIPPEITRLTGITDAMVEGQLIDIQSLRTLIEPADLIIAHNAGFDRPFCEAFSKIFTGKAWACSVSEIDWSARGFEGTKLGYLVGQAGYFHEGHRAVDDCHALLEILDREQHDGESPFTELYRASQRSRIRVFAEHSPFEMKDHLKARGYRWSDGSDGRLKSWWIEVGEEDLNDELSYLRSDIYRWAEAEPPMVRLTAFDRFKL
ncbi:3'-5' exonuclease [Rhizobium leguminosarum]|uniref:Exonuclease RNase T and DNA polymerase III n=1 Tax=Rhizobium leguminosarum bv. trifolii (strain WSM1325) TaxID=395491 RepID=C6B6D4_RHILS|nr:3'-5' exonuclease [Rhizobium leguminosarum]ACS59642.1 Exonuclease RNase T and DNA polymerase III [Rhizobium leguminosarum bv. trifolii WSM1325]MBY2919246.1 3'-5' exonuclease [Rhizobium leguminosarum]MBY2974895.1 3'-5' exonuclease [Rhizobium leguminosarum]MBY2982376.1 3'-5' exonuclease [Rhizobium leguminosarum]MBY3010844.1 3'-5' exonuclease [Rhizobium leguminosarum]